MMEHSATSRSARAAWRVPTPALAALLTLGASEAHAHAFALRYDLPLPLWLYVVGAGATVAASVPFVTGRRLARSARAERGIALREIALGRTLFSSATLLAVRVLSVGVLAVLVAAGLFGVQGDPIDNILPTAIWVVWWVGFAYVSAFLGDFWRAVNPWAAVGTWVALLRRRVGGAEEAPSRDPPEWMGVWPAVALLFAFGWAELVWHENAVPMRLACAILLYSAITWTGMAIWGVGAWLKSGEAFSIFFGLFGRFAPIDPKSLTLRPYGTGLLTARPVSMSMMAFVILALAIVAFDGLAETPFWANVTGLVLTLMHRAGILEWLGYNLAGGLVKSAGLTLTPLVFLGLYLAVCRLSAGLVRDAGHDRGTMALARRFVLALVPIAIAYHLAHYLSYLLIHGQAMIALVSDPFGFGWNLFGTAGYETDTGIVSARFVWFASVAAIVAGHVIAIRLAHVTALEVFGDHGIARRSQYPMIVLMVGYTMLSLWMLSQPIVET